MNTSPDMEEDIKCECPDCKGYGVIYYNEETDYWIDKRTFFVLGDHKDFEEQECDTCCGEGCIEEEVDSKSNFTYGLDRRDRSLAGFINDRLRVRKLMVG